MRFRAKFGLDDWAWQVLAAFALVLFFSGPHRAGSALRGYAILIAILALSRLLLYFFVWWDIGPADLRERRLWSTRAIPWPDIAAVVPWPDRRPNRDHLAIEYARSAPLSDRGTIIAHPGDRAAFLAEIRRHAPQASFAIALSPSPVPAR